VLDGELAVPCSLKSAYAGLNPDGWVLLRLIFSISSVDPFSSAQ